MNGHEAGFGWLVCVCSPRKQELHNVPVAILTRLIESCGPIMGTGVYICTCVDIDEM